MIRKLLCGVYRSIEISTVLQLKSGKVLTGSSESLLRVWNLDSKTQEGSNEANSGVWYMIELSDGRVAAGMGNGDIQIYDIENKKIIQIILFYSLGAPKKENKVELEQNNNDILLIQSTKSIHKGSDDFFKGFI